MPSAASAPASAAAVCVEGEWSEWGPCGVGCVRYRGRSTAEANPAAAAAGSSCLKEIEEETCGPPCGGEGLGLQSTHMDVVRLMQLFGLSLCAACSRRGRRRLCTSARGFEWKFRREGRGERRHNRHRRLEGGCDKRHHSRGARHSGDRLPPHCPQEKGVSACASLLLPCCC